jgi:hypothetical protein
MNRIAAVACLMVLPACASASGGADETRTERATVAVERVGASNTTTTLELSRDAAIVTHELALPPERAWPVLVQTYAALEIPVNGADESGRVLAATDQRLRRIGGRPLTVFFRCSGAYENLAATGDVYVSARTQLLPAQSGGGTQARTEVSAIAQARSGTGSRVACASTGILERTINDKLGELARAPAQ